MCTHHADSLHLGIVPITYMYSNLLISKGKSNLFMWNTIAQSLVQLTILLCTISQGILLLTGLIYTVINIGWLLIWHYFVNKQIHITLWEALKDITPYLLISIAVIGASHFLTLGFHNLYVLLIIQDNNSREPLCIHHVDRQIGDFL